MKKILSIWLCIGMLLVLVSCGGSGTQSTETEAQQTESTAATQETRETKVVTDDSGKILRFGGAKVTVWLVGEAHQQEGVSRVLQGVQSYFLDKWNIDVEICLQAEEGYKEKITLLLTEAQDCDIFCSGLVGFDQALAYGLCYDMTENNLLATYGTDILNRVSPELMDACKYWGGVYGVPSLGTAATGQWCVAIAAEYLEAVGYDLSGLDRENTNALTLAELTELFRALKEKYPEKYMIYPGDFSTLSERILYDPLGGDSFGVLLEPAESTEVSDLFSSELFREYCETVRSWNTLGFIDPEAKSGDDPAAKVREGSLMAYTVAGKPGIAAELSAEREEGAMIVFQLGTDFVHSGQLASAVWSIDSLCQQPEAAMVVLNALYTDTTLVNLLLWGEEDRDVKMTGDGHVSFAKGRSAENYEYYQVLSEDWFPCVYDAYVWEGENIDSRDELQAFNASAEKSQAIGFCFERFDEGVATEYLSLTELVSAETDDLMFGRVDPETGIAALQEKLSAAGLGAYIAEKEAQFADWVARNKG